MADVDVANGLDNPQPDPATPPESPVEDNQAKDQPEPEPHKGGYSKKINKLTARIYAEREGRLKAESALDALRRPNTQHENAQQQPRSETPEAMAERIQRDRFEIEIQRHPGIARYQQNLKAALDEAGLSIKDVEKIKLSNAIIPDLLELDNASEVAFHLAQHPEDYERLRAMSDRQAIAYLGKLSERLTSPRPVSRAPAPVKPVGAASTKSSRSLEELPQREYNRIRDEQERKHRL
jgi:hypothetical protein